MKLFIKQKVFTLGEEFTVKDEYGNDIFYVQGSFFRIPKMFKVFDSVHNQLASIESQMFRLMSHYDIQTHDEFLTVKQNFTFFNTEISIVGKDWRLQGDFFGHEYRLLSGDRPIMSISKHWFTWGDSYMLDIENPDDALLSLCIVIIVDNIMSKNSAAAASSAH